MNVTVDRKTSNYIEDYNQYFPLVYNMIYGKLRDIDVTKDLCQEVFMRFFENYEKVDDSRKWLYGTLRNVVLEYFRRSKRVDVQENEVFENMGMAFVNGFRDTRILIEEALESLEVFENDEDRTIFDLVAVNNYTYKEIGQQLGLSVRQVGYKYNQVVEKIKYYFKQKGIDNLEDLL